MYIGYDTYTLNMNCGSKEIGQLCVDINDREGYIEWQEIPIKLHKDVIKQFKIFNKDLLEAYGHYNLVMTDIAGGLIYEMMKHVKGWTLVKKWKNPNTSNINYMWVNTKVRKK